MFKGLRVFMILSLVTASGAFAAEPIAYCRGSYNRDMGAAQPMEVIIEDGLLWVRPTTSACRPAWCMSLQVSKAQIKSNRHEIEAVEMRRTFRLTTFKKTLKINFQTGQGLATHYESFQSLVKAKKIYLEDCSR